MAWMPPEGAQAPPMTREPFRSIASRMTEDDHRAVARAHEAELRGDWVEAVRLHLSVPFFQHSTRGEQLRLLVGLGDRAPSWMVARHLTQVARRRPEREQAELKRALATAAAIAYPRGFDIGVMGCRWPEQVPSQVFGRDWVARQLDVHELGALDDLVHDADPDLLDRTGVRRWIGAPMGGYRVGAAIEGVLVLHDAHTGAAHRVLDLGLTEQVPAGEHVLGRLVPTDEDPGLVLDWRPLPIDEATAAAVARNPREWPHILQIRCHAGRIPEHFSFLSEPGISSDLPHQSWTALLGRGHDHDLGAGDQEPGRIVGQALDEALRLAGRGPDDVRPLRHSIADLLLDPHLTPERLARHAGPRTAPRWRVLADVVPPHARHRAEAMLLWCELPETG
ncbi:unannotated protein [freshwater metagenome]|uniref:Unannotated protein n=1 Tax=freshwater metagenome TaxID=449393 RepID=A0A6J6T9H8_9ZZZZ